MFTMLNASINGFIATGLVKLMLPLGASYQNIWRTRLCLKKEAKEYAIENYENCIYADLLYTNDSKVLEQSFKYGTVFCYNKANE